MFVNLDKTVEINKQVDVNGSIQVKRMKIKIETMKEETDEV